MWRPRLRRIRVAWAVTVGVAAWASRATAANWSFSFPASYCEAMPGVTANGVDVATAGTPSKFGFSFAPATSPRRIACDVMFPAIVNSAAFTANLTWQTVDSAPSSPPQVCWSAKWEITKPGQLWPINAGVFATAGTTSASVGSVSQADIHSAVNFTAADGNSVVCATGTAPDTCAGSHGMLIISREATANCPNESVQAGVITRIELVGTTP